VWLNLLLACALCNRRKAARFPLSELGDPLLLDPTSDDPAAHLVLSPTTGKYVATTPRGEWSIDVYGLNRPILVDGRRYAWIALQELVTAYARALEAGAEADADELRRVIERYSFAAVFVSLVSLAVRPDTQMFVRQDCVEALQRHPELRGLHP
jgi:hypothetical protein